ncbi:phosphatidate cytidylyltransferase [Pelagibacteraceae bacterium]|nr:phosphatidate cytidylyltransferase [Pelagibacteraceae bacterium]
MTNLNKRIFTSLIVFPVSMFFIIKGGNYIVSFLYAILILANFEAFSAFKRKTSIIFLDSILVVSLLSILHLRNDTTSSLILLIWVIILTISSDIGGYIFGKIFRWKRLTNISPNKTLSGAIGSLIFSIFSILLLGLICKILFQIDLSFFLKFKYFIFAVILSLSAQLGDIMVSYFKRLDKIKDTGKILPGHGGIFDRIDSLMFSTIVANILYYLKLFP